jgi:type III secretion protein N (ATPase)
MKLRLMPAKVHLMELEHFEAALDRALQWRVPVHVTGKVHEAVGTLIRATGLQVTVGELCEIQTRNGSANLWAEVVGFDREMTLLTPYGSLQGLGSQAEVVALGRSHQVHVGYELLGRILDGFGQPMDGLGEITHLPTTGIYNAAPDPLMRQMVEQPHPTGVKVLDGLLTTGQGQRVGIFAAAGAGKSTLMGMLAKGRSDTINVIALIGERGREVREFIEHSLGPDGMARSVLVIATSDKSAVERAKCAYVATSIAEYFREQGEQVLLMMDSLTRFARAQREIGLASGEPPTRRGFPPSVFAELPKLLERAGQGSQGFITAFYTVLVEGEGDQGDPIAEEVRSILDGHIILARKIAAKGIYPSVDVLLSASRVMSLVASREHIQRAQIFKAMLAKYDELEFLLKVGEFKRGGDAFADQTVDKIQVMRQILSQDTDEFLEYEQVQAQLAQIVAGVQPR